MDSLLPLYRSKAGVSELPRFDCLFLAFELTSSRLSRYRNVYYHKRKSSLLSPAESAS